MAEAVLLPDNAQIRVINKVGLAGANTFDDPKDIADQELALVRNMIYDNGVIYPRMGSKRILAKPTGETSDPFQLLVATTSDGIDYQIGVYGTKFYLVDTINNQWINITGTYAPSMSKLLYGYTNWNNGIPDDRFYLCNGFDNVGKWLMGVSTTASPIAPGDLTITLASGTRFPAVGNLLVTTGGVSTSIPYTSVAGNVFTLGAPAGITALAGDTVTMPIIDMGSTVPPGHVFLKSLGRLVVANAYGAENTLHYSVSGDPEDYTISSAVTSGGFYTLYKGKGGILGMSDFGQYFIIEKQDVISTFAFQIASDNSGFIVNVEPVISGDGIGPASSATILNYMNVLYYPTIGEGIVSFSPQATGGQTTTGIQLLSQKINNFVTKTLDFSLSRTCGSNQKLYWLVSQPGIAVPTSVNNLTLVYDLIRGAWSVYDNWNAVDIKPANNKVYFLNINDGALYQTDVGYQDAVNGMVSPYTAVMLSKRFNLDNPEMLMRGIYLYVEGYISLNTTFYITVLYNESGSLGRQTYAIAGDNLNLTSLQVGGGLGFFPLAVPLLGGVDLQTMQALGQPKFFRAYLELSQAFRPHNIQVQAYSVAAGSQWGLSTMAPITVPDQSIETKLVIGPSTAPTILL